FEQLVCQVTQLADDWVYRQFPFLVIPAVLDHTFRPDEAGLASRLVVHGQHHIRLLLRECLLESRGGPARRPPEPDCEGLGVRCPGEPLTQGFGPDRVGQLLRELLLVPCWDHGRLRSPALGFPLLPSYSPGESPRQHSLPRGVLRASCAPGSEDSTR